jgi:uncharacterized protein YktA (UPF0223 family)
VSVYSKFQELVSSKIVDKQIKHFNKITQLFLRYRTTKNDRNYELRIKINKGRYKKDELKLQYRAALRF